MTNTVIVNHKTLGIGEFIKTKKNRHGETLFVVQFFTTVREMTAFTFDMLCTTEDKALTKKLNVERRKLRKQNPNFVKRYGASYGYDSFFDGGRAEDINCSPTDLFEAIGYIINHAKFVEAEVSQDKVEIFEDMFGTDNLNVAYIHNDCDNNRNQFRIDFRDTENIPKVLEDNMIEACGFGRIAKSLFVEKLVKEYGFRFGATQDVEAIRQIAKERGYIKEFERGLAL